MEVEVEVLWTVEKTGTGIEGLTMNRGEPANKPLNIQGK
jgi:hypothetical protein